MKTIRLAKSVFRNNNVSINNNIFRNGFNNYNNCINRSFTSTVNKSNITEEQNKKLEEKTQSKFFKGDVALEGVKSDGTSLRWYKTTGYTYDEELGGYLPTIDDRRIKTPNDILVVVPSKEIALSIAAEWAAQEKYIRPARLPITQTIITCLEIRPEGREKVIGEFLNHLATDPTCNREMYDSKLQKLQKEFFDPVVNFASEYYGKEFTISKHLETSKHPQELLTSIKDHLNSMNNFELCCLQLISQSAKSYLLALNLYYGKIRLDNLYKSIALEEEYQAEVWGKVPFGHDLAECESHNEIAPPLFILRNMKPIPLPQK
ncbi:hypothetical protein DICPUDRAFT_154531 [Dictyostelium purpureum]|uniref:ATP synthase mitochondrial F1 complex assembly factor 2 n=1 Tax=Dictyostelium purpureum TaxID=5786 RepID=F0ZRK7_DICPU|nr:uncharacterized protein DICPUDRAFT_154531 [Dictyostelium purpureum]EGC33436.1 hypothetical protein DICPUDRAFT_154531 [Dictyostelium purpureum]|eukprot:XP_003290055.1 hypothetical protein DICPUDRAFT_154531 [Dictyostelium purpureum]